jgi:single-strand DNA-binding protein
MANAKTVTKIGNITRDPEIRFGESKKAYCRFGLAVDVPVEPGNWSGPKETVFYEVTCFESLAVNVTDSLSKGMRVIVHGRPESQDWTDKEGNARVTKRILANGCGPELLWATAKVTKTPKAPAKTEPEQAATDADTEDDF